MAKPKPKKQPKKQPKKPPKKPATRATAKAVKKQPPARPKPAKHPPITAPTKPVPLPPPTIIVTAPAGKAPSVATQRKQLLDGKTIPELRVMLRKNDQITTGNKSKLVKRILDCVEHGAMPRCPQCGLGRLRLSKTYGFRCPGGYDDDEYMFCGFTAAVGEIERPVWQFETPGGLI